MPNIFNITSNLPFLDSLAKGILERFGDDPLTLCNITILLPNRRSCRFLAESFLRASDGKSLLLPKMQAIGDMDDDEMELNIGAGGELLPPVISSTGQRLLLATLIEEWQKLLNTEEKITTSQAAHLSIELAAFLADVEKEQLSLAKLAKIVPDELSAHWQITLQFLHILIKEWPGILQEKGLISLNSHRNLSLARLAEYWQENPPAHPVIAAGSTGSITATANLLKTIADMDSGMVILPGLDKHIDDKSWEKLEESHPQYGLKKLLEYCGEGRDNVPEWLPQKESKNGRTSLTSEIMRPVATCGFWQHMDKIEPEILEGLQLIDCENLQEEAVIISLLMKRQLDNKGKTAALITNDRGLAGRVAAIMKKWEIEVDDSSGRELSATPQAVYLRLLSKLAEDRASPISLLSCLKHPFASDAAMRKNIRKLEMLALRGLRPGEGLKGIGRILQQEGDEKLVVWFSELELILQKLIDAMQKKQILLSELLELHIATAEKLAGSKNLWSGDAGEKLKEFFDELILSSAGFKAIDPSDYSGIIDALLIGQKYRKSYGTHPRLFILSPMEARMLHFDLVILGELNEGSWPMEIKADPWMSRPMRKEFGLPLPERKIGQSAHDFIQFLNASDVVMTRCAKSGGSQTRPSRWLLRLDIVLKKHSLRHMIEPVAPWRQWANMLDKPDNVVPCLAPAPTPPVNTRPKKLSVTAIEKLMRDPYAIYAAKILKLKALKELDQDPGAAEFGNFVHDALEIFVNNYDSVKEDEAYNYLLQCGRNILEKQETGMAAASLWWPRFERIAAWFIKNEPERREGGTKIIAEISGKYEMDGFTLEARADRLEINNDGNISLIDYKTGTVPSATDVALGLSPQMTLEALIAGTSGFGIKGEVAELSYWRLTGGENPVEEKNAVKPQILAQILEEAEAGLKLLIKTFNDENTPYLACPNPDKAPRYNDYEHLERVKEWG